MRESHYLFSNINFNSVSALRISILLLSCLKNLIIFFKIKSSLGINNNIIPRMNKSMRKNTESIDVTKVFQHSYTILNTNICSDTLAQLAYSESNIKLVIQLPCSAIFLLLKKQSGLKSSTPRGFSPRPKVMSANFSLQI